MVTVPQDLLQELVCSGCSGVLRRGPVFQRHDGAAVCGLCQEQEGAAPASRCRLYEATARLLLFPCRYQDEGCSQTVPFTPAESEGPAHEEACEYRVYVCPVLGPEHCEWSGRPPAFLQHCRDQHPEHVLDNPATVSPDIRHSLSLRYLIPTFHFLFVLHTQVCVTTASLYYAVRLLEEPLRTTDYNYTVTVRREEDTFCWTRKVQQQESLIQKQHSALQLNIDSMLVMLGGWDGATLSVEVRRRDEAGVEPGEAKPEQETCGECGARTARLYRDKDRGWLCKRFAPEIETCNNKGCNYKDFREKSWKHSKFWCKRRTTCFVCNNALTCATPAQHYLTCRHVKKGVGLLLSRGPAKWFLMKSGVGPVMCWSVYTEDSFWLEVMALASGRQLSRYSCEVRLECAGHTRTFTPHLVSSDEWDWEVIFVDRQFLSGSEVRFWLDIKRTE